MRMPEESNLHSVRKYILFSGKTGKDVEFKLKVIRELFWCKIVQNFGDFNVVDFSWRGTDEQVCLRCLL